MPLYEKSSRYMQYADVVEVVDDKGRTVKRIGRARAADEIELGEHILRDGQRLDHLANYYLRDPHAFWRICELNNVMLPDALAARALVKISTRS